MKRNSLRRLGALVLALALALSLAPPAWAAAPGDSAPFTATISASPATAKVGETITLTATLENIPTVAGNLMVSWEADSAVGDIFEADNAQTSETKYVVTGLKEGTVKIVAKYWDSTDTNTTLATSNEVTITWTDDTTPPPPPR